MEQRFPMEQGVLRCRQVGDRAELTMEVPGPGQGRPFPLVPAFCLAQVKNLGGRRYVVYHFTPEGRPFVEGTAAEG